MISKKPCGDHPHTGPPARAGRDQRAFLLQRAQPVTNGLIDGSLSTLAPIFAVAFATHQPHYAFLAGLATALGAGVSMAFSEGLSDTGDLTGRGNPFLRGKITGAGTFLGGILHTLPFLIPAYRAALAVALATIVFELVALAWIRWRFFATGFLPPALKPSRGLALAFRRACTCGLWPPHGMAAGRASLRHCDLATHPGPAYSIA
jgi:hypothetical protein